jgi:hypothetical protein
MRLASVSSRPKYLRSPATHPLIMPHTHAEYATLVMARTLRLCHTHTPSMPRWLWHGHNARGFGGASSQATVS